jgi:uncharacterized protein YcaQ
MTKSTLPLSAVRAIALHAQRLGSPLTKSKDNRSGIEAITDTVEAIGCVQIDTLHMVHRSQYVALWSRLGTYDVSDFDKLVYTSEHRRFFEYWLKAACIIPLKHYRYSLPKMKMNQNGNKNAGWKRWLADPKNIELVEQVRQHVRENGAVRGGDFEYDGPKRGSWWDWKPAKIALEYLYDCGELMIAERVKFQRVYDLSERVLPDWVNDSEPSEDEFNRHRIELGAKALGICEPLHTADYSYTYRTMGKQYVKILLDEGKLVEVKGETADGKTKTLVVHRDNLPLVEQAADGVLKAERTTFLSPFDSLFWARRRDMLFWNFFQTLEAYVPEPKRRWGYFCLPILHKDRLVGRFDPKLERKTGTLRLKALHLEPGVEPSEKLASDVAAAMRDFLTFHQAKDVVIEKSNPTEFGEKLLKAL